MPLFRVSFRPPSDLFNEGKVFRTVVRAADKNAAREAVWKSEWTREGGVPTVVRVKRVG